MKLFVWSFFRELRAAFVNYWQKYLHKLLVKRLKDQANPGKNVSRLTDWLDMAITLFIGP